MTDDTIKAEQHRRFAAKEFLDTPATHTLVFAHVDAQGIRLGELARQTQLTKQLVNYLVTTLEERGYVECVPDPIDGRARIVRLTERGQQAAQVGRAIIESIEREWAASLGSENMDELCGLLERLVGVLE